MLSVLIPVYNWDITSLVKQIHDQCEALAIEFEIIALDDFSPNLDVKQSNSSLQLAYYKYVQSETNLGNAEARNELSRLAKFDNLLFLDCDVIPVRQDFVKRYLEFKDEEAIVCGGIIYENYYESRFSLRWKFGKKHEETSPIESQKKPYLNIRGCNFFISKEIFTRYPFTTLHASYGYVDTFFALSLQKANIKALHIDNPVYHLGLEENKIYVHKFEKSIKNAKWLMKVHPEIAEHLRLVEFYKKIKKYKVNGFISFLYRLLRKPILNNLYSANPSLFLFQVYKIGYLCSLNEE